MASDQKKKELDKYTRNFVTKSLQVIVQSRMGEKCRYTAKENSSLEWFSLPIPEIPELSAVARKTLGSGPILSEPVNVEISLKTKENNAYIFLEVWSISLDVDSRDPDVKISSTVYSRMTLALKSILSVSRVAPAYRLAQRQKKDDFQIHFQYNLGPPNLAILREDVQTRRIAAVATPAGTIRVTLSYTTKPQMPQQPRPGVALLPKHDHFGLPRAGQLSEPKPCNRKFRNQRSVEDLRILETAEKQDTFATTFSTSPPDGTVCSVSPPPLPQIDETNGTLTDSTDEKQESKKSPFEGYQQAAAFLQGESKSVPVERPEDRPFASLMAGLPMPGAADSSADGSVSDASVHEEAEEEEAKEESEHSGDEQEAEEEGGRSQSPISSDFVMLPPLESPFRDTDPASDLGQFYREMQLAPQAPLSMCQDHTVGFEEYLADIKGQIEEYTAKQPNFDKFVKSICKEDEEFSD